MGREERLVDLNPKLLLQKGMTWGCRLLAMVGFLCLVTYSTAAPTSGIVSTNSIYQPHSTWGFLRGRAMYSPTVCS